MPLRARAPPRMQRRTAAPTATALKPQSTPRQPTSHTHAPPWQWPRPEHPCRQHCGGATAAAPTTSAMRVRPPSSCAPSDGGGDVAMGLG
eukprot:scaffold40659_cov71-Phaeocystis_antarctica.AAC.2